ncbi:small nuclear ribonucleoprotein E-like [Gossypium australe]|uniref:Small nuclear ribonucleoprotein E n=1 Tax=Gossypium australe TaxID=47621 RepID=A0A5B6VGP3_9ROSI|nr:small nuclear ribonucleoprotein E-like [Gossypium australe]
MASTKVQRIMTQPINLIFRFLQSKARIQIWLFEQKDLRIEGRIIGTSQGTLPEKVIEPGFDEYMNLVLDDAEEVNVKKKSRKSLGRILLKGDNITLMMNRQFTDAFA